MCQGSALPGAARACERINTRASDDHVVEQFDVYYPRRFPEQSSDVHVRCARRGITARMVVYTRDAFRSHFLSEENLANIRALNEIAKKRGQSLAQMAIAWVLKDPRVTTALIGASKVSQIDDSLGALKSPAFSPDELAQIDRYAKDGNVNIWSASSAA